MSTTTLITPASATQDCWKKIGVWGEGTCAELKTVKHCRNCPVYASVGLGLLDRGLPPEYLESATAQLARPKPARVVGTRSALVFRIGAEWLALAVAAFVEVVERRVLHTVPHAPSKILKGLVNVRGELLVCVSLGQLLGLADQVDSAPQSVYERLLVVARDGQRLVFPVNEISGIHRYRPDDLKEVPSTVAQSPAPYIKSILPWQRTPRAGAAPGLEQISVGLLDDELLFYTLNRSLA